MSSLEVSSVIPFFRWARNFISVRILHIYCLIWEKRSARNYAEYYGIREAFLILWA